MNRRLQNTTIVYDLIIPTLMTLIFIGVLLTPQEWKLIPALFFGLVVVSAWAISLTLLYKKWKARPTFSFGRGINVWTNGIAEIDEGIVSEAIEYFTVNIHKKFPDISVKELENMFNGLQLEFTKEKPLLKFKRVAGIQKGRWVKCFWNKGFASNAFFHECLHMVHELVMEVPIDYEHNRPEWCFIPEMQTGWGP